MGIREKKNEQGGQLLGTRLVFIAVCFSFLGLAYAQTRTAAQQAQTPTFMQRLRESRFEREGSPIANELLQELIESRDIYLKNIHGGVPHSNDQRARMLKWNFKQHLDTEGDNAEKALVKFGDSHLYKGFNEIHQRDLGNYIAQTADASESRSLHIFVLARRVVILCTVGISARQACTLYSGHTGLLSLAETSYRHLVAKCMDALRPV